MKKFTIKIEQGYIRASQIGTNEYCIEQLYITPEHRGYGYAKKLMQWVWIKLHKPKKVWVVASSNFGADLYRLIDFYKNFGFRITGSGDNKEQLMIWNYKNELPIGVALTNSKRGSVMMSYSMH